MGHAITFDTLAYAKKLKAAGFTEQQAEVQAESIAELIEERLATKRDIEELRADLIRNCVEIRKEITTMGYKVIISLGSMLVIGLTALSYLLKIQP